MFTFSGTKSDRLKKFHNISNCELRTLFECNNLKAKRSSLRLKCPGSSTSLSLWQALFLQNTFSNWLRFNIQPFNIWLYRVRYIEPCLVVKVNFNLFSWTKFETQTSSATSWAVEIQAGRLVLEDRRLKCGVWYTWLFPVRSYQTGTRFFNKKWFSATLKACKLGIRQNKIMKRPKTFSWSKNGSENISIENQEARVLFPRVSSEYRWGEFWNPIDCMSYDVKSLWRYKISHGLIEERKRRTRKVSSENIGKKQIECLLHDKIEFNGVHV